jgi:hypothetical protein
MHLDFTAPAPQLLTANLTRATSLVAQYPSFDAPSGWRCVALASHVG